MMVAMTHPTANTAVDCQNPLAVGSTMREKAMSSPMKIRNSTAYYNLLWI